MRIRDWFGKVRLERKQPIALVAALTLFVVASAGPAAAQTATIRFGQSNYAVPRSSQATVIVVERGVASIDDVRHWRR